MITWDDARNLEADCRELSNDDWMTEESEAEARERMTEEEQQQDDAYLALVQRRSQPLKERGKRNAWGTWRKRAGVAARKGRAGG